MTEDQVSKAGFDLHNAMTNAMFHALMAYKFGDATYLATAKTHLRKAMEETDATSAQEAPPVAAE